MKTKRSLCKKSHDNQRGAALVITLMILALMSAIGISATDTSDMEVIISGAQRDQQVAFYTAEAGIEHAKGILRSLFVSANSSKVASGATPDWDFALIGATTTDFAGGAVWIDNGTAGGRGTYTVRVWNNQDAGSATSPTDDTDGKILVRSVSTGASGGVSTIEITLAGYITGGGAISGYSAQAGAGSGKAYTAEDAAAIAAGDLATQQLSLN